MQNMNQSESVPCQLCFLKPDSTSERTLRQVFIYLTGYDLVVRKTVKYLLFFCFSVICSYIGRFIYASFRRDNLLPNYKNTCWSYNCYVVLLHMLT